MYPQLGLEISPLKPRPQDSRNLPIFPLPTGHPSFPFDLRNALKILIHVMPLFSLTDFR